MIRIVATFRSCAWWSIVTAGLVGCAGIEVSASDGGPQSRDDGGGQADAPASDVAIPPAPDVNGGGLSAIDGSAPGTPESGHSTSSYVDAAPTALDARPAAIVDAAVAVRVDVGPVGEAGFFDSAVPQDPRRGAEAGPACSGAATFEPWSRTDAIAYSPDGRLVATGGEPRIPFDGGVGIASDASVGIASDATNGSDASRLNDAGRAAPDRDAVAVSAALPNVRIWDAANGNLVQSIPGHGGTTYTVAFSPDGKLLATGGLAPGALSTEGTSADTAKIWNVSTGELVRTLDATSGSYVDWAEFSHDGTRLVTAGVHGPVEIWNVADWTLVQTIAPHSGTVYAARFSLDDSLVAIAGLGDGVVDAGGSAGLWRVADGTLVRHLGEHATAVSGIAFSPDGSMVALTTYDQRLTELRRTADGSLLQTLPGDGMYLTQAVWIDTDRLLTNDWGGWVNLWARTGDRFVRTCTFDAGTQSVGLAVAPNHHEFRAGGGQSGVEGMWNVAF